ncbi:hotdog fold thioesterase [Rhodococcus spelaei]|uniref:Hotdog fold thioesterase n=1 Tax=Rhodococcus spelaei TaxID=2546320 RepID=A0A541B7Y9_9NOCA|nr:hotdog fold thioesterase [Rhodococcus spelaei]TQF68445.1 hotdog fold thioesterase [Rhodococcus spelaei]
MSTTTAPAPTPQALFRVGPPIRAGERNRMTMDLGRDSGLTPTAALGVLLDDILGFTMFERRGDRAGLVSADLSVDFVRPTGWVGGQLVAESRLETLTTDGGMSSVRVVDGAGRLVASGTAWGNFLDGVDQERTSAAPTAPDPSPLPWAPPIELLDGHLERTEFGARLTVPANRALANAMGVMHGGVQACAYDLVGNAAAAAASVDSLHTSSLRINFFRPVSLDGPAVFEAEVVRSGRLVSVVRVTGRDATGRDCGVATVTCRRDTDETTPGC